MTVQQQLQESRAQQIRAEIDAISKAPKATATEALRYVTALLASYPGQQSQDDRVARAYARQLRDLCAGVDLDVLQAMINPKSGLVSRQKFLPAIAEVSAFIEEKMEPKLTRLGWHIDELERLEKKPDPPINDEERKRRAEMLRKTAAVIRETAKSTQRANRAPVQADCREEIAAGTLHISAEELGRAE